MIQSQTAAALSPARKRLIRMMQELNFGRIEGLAVRGGEPILDQVRVIRLIKLGGDNGPRPELEHSDFVLKNQIIQLFTHFAELVDGSIETLEVQHGLPFRLVIKQPA